MTAGTNPPPAPGRKPEPALGPDEEGEIPLDPPTNHDNRPGAWVKEDDDGPDRGANR